MGGSVVPIRGVVIGVGLCEVAAADVVVGSWSVVGELETAVVESWAVVVAPPSSVVGLGGAAVVEGGAIVVATPSSVVGLGGAAVVEGVVGGGSVRRGVGS